MILQKVLEIGMFVSETKIMQEIFSNAEKYAITDDPVLILGHSGVGKEILAKIIHMTSPRSGRPFIAVNCGAIPEGLFESEMFGHEKGAFTGANYRKVGYFERANGSTIFLDEISELPLYQQVKLLRAIQEQEIYRVGNTKPIKVDVRIISATNSNLEKEMRDGRFREDLFYRIDVLSIYIPPLRKRKDDIIPLAEHFLNQFAACNGSKGIAPEVDDILIAYPWPGNVRELKSIISKAVLMSESDIILLDDLPRHLIAQKTAAQRSPKTLEDMEKEHIMAVLAETGGNQTKASEMLGINRKTLYKKINKYKIFS